MKFHKTDGGRAEAGYKGQTRDCACRAIAIATGRPYAEVYAELDQIGGRERSSNRRGGAKSSARSGIFAPTMRRYMAAMGWTWVPCMKIGQGCTVHLRDGELPMGRLIVSLSRHYAAVIDGVIHDTHNPSRGGTRCVYGFWSKPSN